MATRAGTPCCSNSVAAVWRASCERASRTPAVSSSAFHACQSARGSIGRPFPCANSRSPSCHSLPARMHSSSWARRCARKGVHEGARQRDGAAPSEALGFHEREALPRGPL